MINQVIPMRGRKIHCCWFLQRLKLQSWVSRKLRPLSVSKTQTPESLKKLNPWVYQKLRPLGASKTQTIECLNNSDLWVSPKLRPLSISKTQTSGCLKKSDLKNSDPKLSWKLSWIHCVKMLCSFETLILNWITVCCNELFATNNLTNVFCRYCCRGTT